MLAALRTSTPSLVDKELSPFPGRTVERGAACSLRLIHQVCWGFAATRGEAQPWAMTALLEGVLLGQLPAGIGRRGRSARGAFDARLRCRRRCFALEHHPGGASWAGGCWAALGSCRALGAPAEAACFRTDHASQGLLYYG